MHTNLSSTYETMSKARALDWDNCDLSEIQSVKLKIDQNRENNINKISRYMC